MTTKKSVWHDLHFVHPIINPHKPGERLEDTVVRLRQAEKAFSVTEDGAWLDITGLGPSGRTIRTPKVNVKSALMMEEQPVKAAKSA